ncbi:MAG TPA: thioredoxin family protein [Aquabacterium sp.]|nr:thioredoxin family protein [Aquabacterium sp.]
MKERLRHLAIFCVAVWAMKAFALDLRPYSAEAFAQAQRAGQPVALHFHAAWCPTCLVQERVIQSLQSDPALTLTVLVVDYDKDRSVAAALRVPAQSVILVYRGTRELSMLAGTTDKARIRAAFLAAQQP